MLLELQVLHVPGCANLASMLHRLRAATDLPVSTREISTDAEAVAGGMVGSPTLLINGVDPFAERGECDCTVSCRLYRDDQGRIVPAPSIEQLRDAITAATSAAATTRRTAASNVAADAAATSAASNAAAVGVAVPAGVLSAWRTRALPLDPVEKAMHQAILRSFAMTGHPPAAGDLETVAVRGGATAQQVLSALHELDAIRLSPAGQIVVAYPFSAAPSRHRVRIADRVDVYAMCAIDALGIGAMLGESTRIESVDVSTGQPITVVMAADRVTWEPAGAVVFVGADAGGGASADCCCDYLNFFASVDAATTWRAAHPHVPGQIVDQTEAIELGRSLFGALLER